MSFPNNKKGS